MPPSAKELQLISFRIGPEIFAADIMVVRQVIPHSAPTPIPNAPPFVEGVLVVQGQAVPVVDIRERLYRGQRQSDDQPYVLVVRSSAGSVGLTVDEVQDIFTTPSEALLPPPPLVGEVSGDLLVGILPRNEQVVLVVDLNEILTASETAAVQSVRGSSGGESVR